jgi:hypothetical protein
MTPMSAMSAPASMPGKNPTATAPPGNRGHSGVFSAAAGFVESMPVAEGFGLVGLEEVDEAGSDFEDAPVELVALLMTHCELLSQE